MLFKLNNKEYDFNKEITFRELLKMEKCGVALTKIENEPINQATSMVCYVTGLSKEKAIKEIEEHYANGGSISDILDFLNILLESNFFKKVGAKK